MSGRMLSICPNWRTLPNAPRPCSSQVERNAYYTVGVIYDALRGVSNKGSFNNRNNSEMETKAENSSTLCTLRHKGTNTRVRHDTVSFCTTPRRAGSVLTLMKVGPSIVSISRSSTACASRRSLSCRRFNCWSISNEKQYGTHDEAICPALWVTSTGLDPQ